MIQPLQIATIGGSVIFAAASTESPANSWISIISAGAVIATTIATSFNTDRKIKAMNGALEDFKKAVDVRFDAVKQKGP